MTHKIRTRVTRCDPVDLDRLAAALVAIVGDLDEKERKRLAAEGRRLLKELEPEKDKPDKRRGAAA